MLPVILHATEPEKIEEYRQNLALSLELPSQNQLSVRLLPKKKEISVDQVREIAKELLRSPSIPRLVILYDFDTASEEAQNALLKTLEEQRSNQQFILQTNNPYRVLPTIRSRSTIIEMGKEIVTDTDTEIITLVNTLSSPDYLFLSHPLSTVTTEAKALDIVDRLISYIRKHELLAKPQVPSVLTTIIKQRGLIINNNANPQLTVDAILFQLHSLFSH